MDFSSASPEFLILFGAIIAWASTALVFLLIHFGNIPKLFNSLFLKKNAYQKRLVDDLLQEMVERNNRFSKLMQDDQFEKELTRTIVLEAALYGRVTEIRDNLSSTIDSNETETLTSMGLSEKIGKWAKKGFQYFGDKIVDKVLGVVNSMLGTGKK